MDLKRLIITDLNYVKSLLLSEHLIEIFNMVERSRTMIAVQLSMELDISIQNSSSKLNKLFAKGYLERKEIVSTTGGIEYIYKSCI